MRITDQLQLVVDAIDNEVSTLAEDPPMTLVEDFEVLSEAMTSSGMIRPEMH